MQPTMRNVKCEQIWNLLIYFGFVWHSICICCSHSTMDGKERKKTKFEWKRISTFLPYISLIITNEPWIVINESIICCSIKSKYHGISYTFALTFVPIYFFFSILFFIRSFVSFYNKNYYLFNRIKTYRLDGAHIYFIHFEWNLETNKICHKEKKILWITI